jgi:molybdopterin-containing oxidoreductase family iron-sulfur binding subunit
VTEKCTFCVHRLEKGLLPACVVNCPSRALNFGDLDDPNSNVSKLLDAKPSFRLEEEQNTQPRVHYVSGSPPGTEVRQIEAIKARE